MNKIYKCNASSIQVSSHRIFIIVNHCALMTNLIFSYLKCFSRTFSSEKVKICFIELVFVLSHIFNVITYSHEQCFVITTNVTIIIIFYYVWISFMCCVCVLGTSLTMFFVGLFWSYLNLVVPLPVLEGRWVFFSLLRSSYFLLLLFDGFASCNCTFFQNQKVGKLSLNFGPSVERVEKTRHVYLFDKKPICLIV